MNKDGIKLSKSKAPGIVKSKGSICYSVQGMANGITGVPPAPKAYANLDEPGYSELRLTRANGGGSGISVKKFSSKGGKK